MEESILQDTWVSFTQGIPQNTRISKEIQQNADIFQDLSKIYDHGMGAAEFSGYLSHTAQHTVHICQDTYKVYPLNSHNNPFQIMCQRLLKSPVGDPGYG